MDDAADPESKDKAPVEAAEDQLPDQGQAPEEDMLPPEAHIQPDALKDQSHKEEIMGVRTGAKGDTAMKEEEDAVKPEDSQQQQAPEGSDQNQDSAQQPGGSTDDLNWQAAARPQPSGGGAAQPKPKGSDANPYESLGDALKKFRQRVELLQRPADSQPEASAEPPAPSAAEEQKAEAEEDGGLFEHVAENEAAAEQALAAASQEQMEQMPDIEKPKADQEASLEDRREEQHQDEDMKDNLSKTEAKPKPVAGQKMSGGAARLPDRPDEEDEDEDDLDTTMEDTFQRDLALTLQREREAGATSHEQQLDSLIGAVTTMAAAAAVPETLPVLSKEEAARLRAELDTRLQLWQAAPASGAAAEAATAAVDPRTAAHELWRMFEQVTAELSMQLCEQLRIILEPV
jgi:midasin